MPTNITARKNNYNVYALKAYTYEYHLRAKKHPIYRILFKIGYEK